jgi:hypothetical protein
MEELQEVSRPVLERAVQMWQPKKFFSFYLSSLKYLAHTGYNFVRIAIPSAAAAVVWAVLTAVRVVVLFFSMIILVVGPKIGLPRAIYQVITLVPRLPGCGPCLCAASVKCGSLWNWKDGCWRERWIERQIYI